MIDHSQPVVIRPWPGLMHRGIAADYCSMSKRRFMHLVALGVLPSSVLFGNSRYWRKVDLDAVIESREPFAPAPDDLDSRLANFAAS